ncbi:MAG TPA: alkaline phosphatase PhoX, partial [Vampirovibrionales bacterium]
MNIKRREFLLFFSGFAGTVALSSLQSCNFLQGLESPFKSQRFNFKPVKGPLPVSTDGIVPTQQIAEYSTYEVLDDLVLPEGFTYDAIAQWGDPVGDSRFGYNNDYLSFIETAPNEGYLVINFEYVSAGIWMQTYPLVIRKPLPLEAVKSGISTASKGEKPTTINAFALADNNPLKAQIQQICEEALIDQGLGVISLRQTPEGQWERTNSPADRRISGISGLKDGRYLKVTGPGVKIFQKQQVQGYGDGLGDRIIGTFGNCAGGTTPWGTVLSAEENFQSQVPEPVYADGSSFDPGELPFDLAVDNLDGQGNVLGLAGNKYGWIVEIDPADPNDYGTKHTWLGRYRHEAVGVRVESGKPLAFYSGCDRQGGHLYKFVSQGIVANPSDKSNSTLLSEGQLYGAKFNPDGSGTWIPLTPETAINPQLPSQLVGNVISLPKREPLTATRQRNQTQGGY